jgi:outer membrane putative beta-barrel porin/alpha-amylase
VEDGNSKVALGAAQLPRHRQPDVSVTRFQMRCVFILVAAALSAMCPLLPAQDLAPRAYLITPLHSNAINLTYSFFTGGLDFNGVVPVAGGTGTYSAPIVSVYHSLSFFGRSANIAVWTPYGVGHFQGDVMGTTGTVYRSGLFDSGVRFSVNLKGGPAMPASQFMKWKQKTVLGVSLKVIAPTGQYDPNRLINWGINRWAFKPEFGYSHRFGKLILDGYAGVWFFTTNQQSFGIPTPQPQTKSPVGAFEGHLSYDAKKYRGQLPLWFSLDGNFWFGGTTSVGGISNPATSQTASRIGVTAAIPLRQHQSIKASFSTGSYVRVGSNYKNLSVSWQYSWLGRPR